MSEERKLRSFETRVFVPTRPGVKPSKGQITSAIHAQIANGFKYDFDRSKIFDESTWVEGEQNDVPGWFIEVAFKEIRCQPVLAHSEPGARDSQVAAIVDTTPKEKKNVI